MGDPILNAAIFLVALIAIDSFIEWLNKLDKRKRQR